jgi:hypothetical protein
LNITSGEQRKSKNLSSELDKSVSKSSKLGFSEELGSLTNSFRKKSLKDVGKKGILVFLALFLIHQGSKGMSDNL